MSKKTKLKLRPEIKIFLSKIMILIIIFLTVSILIKKDNNFKTKIKTKVFEESFKFTKTKSLYEKYFGNILSLDKVVKETTPVFQERISYIEDKKYHDGVELTVSDKYLVPVIESGIVVYIGEKENYGSTIIVEQINGIDVFYSNINPINIKIYDYVEKGELLGETKNNKLYLIFQKDGQILNYKDYV